MALLLTAPGDLSAEVFNADASRAWHHFVTLLRRAYPGAKLEFWRVAELQARGHVHFHVVLRGLRFLPVPLMRRLAVQAGFGPFVGIKRPRDYPGGVRSLGWYFSKYLLKHYQRGGGVTKLVTFSQGWRVGWVDRRSEGTGRWVFAGPVGAPWAWLGQEVEKARERSPVPSVWRPPWHHGHSHWRAVRARENLGIAMGLQAVYDPVG